MDLIFSKLFSTNNCFVSFEVIFLLRLDSLESKPVFVIELVCTYLELKTTATKLLKFEAVIYFPRLEPVSFSSSLLIFVS